MGQAVFIKVVRVDAVILARGGAKGIPKKNIIDFCGKPLIAWTIIQCLASKQVSNVWVSSDSDEILDISKKFGANIIKRPDKISGDNEPSESAWMHAINHIESKIKYDNIDYIVAPQVTSPLRRAKDFDDCSGIRRRFPDCFCYGSIGIWMYIWFCRCKPQSYV